MIHQVTQKWLDLYTKPGYPRCHYCEHEFIVGEEVYSDGEFPMLCVLCAKDYSSYEKSPIKYPKIFESFPKN